MALALSFFGCGAASGPEPGLGDGEQPLVDCSLPVDRQPAPVGSVQQGLGGATFTGIGDLPDGAFLSEARDVDAAGERVVGVGTSASGKQAVVWTHAAGLVALADGASAASAISDTGCVVVGAARTFRAPQEGERTMAARWVGSASAEFGPEPVSVYRRSEAIAVSGDGGTIIGRGYQDILPSGFIWRGNEFSNRPPDNIENQAANEDGSVVVGRTSPSRSGGPSYALRNGKVLPYPFEPECPSMCTPCITPGQCVAAAYGVSADGTIVVGSAVNNQAGGPSVAVRWTVAADAVSTTILSTISAAARAVSADGRVVVGTEAPAGEGIATRWVDGHAESIAAALESQGVSSDGWQLTSATNVSGDGQSIVGTGINPDGNSEGWLARLPVY
jgi:uncharacterized membrane protein